MSTEEKQEAPVGQVKIPLTNWAMEPLVINNGQILGTVEEVSLVSNGDVVWKKQPDLVTRISSSAEQLQGRKRHIEQHLNVGNECSHNERNSLLQLLLEKHQVFALSDEELGETDLVEHQIEMSEHKPFKVFPRRLPYALREELEVELDQLLYVGCIEPSSSPYASGLVLVRKKDGGLRVCVDYRGINKNTVPDRYPFPRVDELIDTVGKQKGKFFTSLDLMKGYHQIRVADCDKPKTAFICHRGLLQYRRMPFGLTNAPATFQRLMGKLFGAKEWDFLFVYLDDLLIVSRTLDEHKRHIRKVLHRLEEANLRLKPQKCFFAQTRIEYLGHTLTA